MTAAKFICGLESGTAPKGQDARRAEEARADSTFAGYGKRAPAGATTQMGLLERSPVMDKVLLAGFGGQGVMFLGKVLAYSGMLAGREVCWIPSYGPEMRGGTANCSVILATDEIYSPVVETADAGIVLNQPSYDKFLSRIKPGGALVVNSSIVNLGQGRKDIDLIPLPAGEIANHLGHPALTNMVSLGALLTKLKMIDLSGVEKALSAIVGEKGSAILEANLAAINQGMKI